MKIGQRAGAILSADTDTDTIQLLGYGVYEGYFIPGEEVGGLASMVRECGHPNPRIKLDNGKEVYGCECWWGPEKTIQKRVAAYSIVEHVDIEKVRRQDGD